MNAHLPPTGYHSSLALSGVLELMTGVHRITQDSDGVVTAWYVDGEKESCVWPELHLTEENNVFEIVGTIQQKARMK